eukprot:CAMPEP_0178530130 /NCGR_PEP_ID=MMETSP0696-20121128/32703_1 /TAXON_ID=265572 /ORGANISM="Extubocellulus spinifer, Strain CCMP396" /LENGTH=147 /DNA_ID=CAMNT_0020161893 /DNA_START=20 /DNA_END=463 /DNA_ORIENTATION=+
MTRLRATPFLAVLLAVLSASADAYNGGRQWWDGAGCSETAPTTTTGHFQTHTDMARERMRGAPAYVPFAPSKDQAQAKRRANARIAAQASTAGRTWHETSGTYGGTTNGFNSYTDEQRMQQKQRMMEEAQMRYQEKQQRLRQGQQMW